MPNEAGKSLPVSTRCTPAYAAARETSIDSLSACGWGERSIFMCSMRGSTTSSAKRVRPVTLARPSTRRRALPMTFIGHPPRAFFDRLDDLLVAGAAAKVAGNRLLDALARRLRLVRKQRLGGEQDARRAVTALRGAQVGKGGLQRMEPRARFPRFGHTFHRFHRAPGALERQHQAGELRLAVDQHRAGAALAELAA